MNRTVLITASTFSHIKNFHLPYLNEFRKTGWDVHVAYGGTGEPLKDVKRIYELPLTKSLFALKNFRTCFIIRKAVKENSYELIICHTSLAAFYTRLALKGIKNRPRTINVVHGYLFSERDRHIKSKALQLCEIFLRNQTDTVLTMNRYDFKWAKQHRAAKTVNMIPGMGFKEDRLLPVHRGQRDRDAFVMLYLAEFSERKNQTFLIKAMTLLPDDCRLVLGGEGALREKCMELSDTLGLSGRIRFPGYISDIKQAFRDADVAVSSSRSEGLPFNILEAMFSGLPVVASSVKGHTDLITDGENGYLFHLEDLQSFVNAILKLRTDRDRAMRMGEAAAVSSSNYVLDQVKMQVMRAYLDE